MAEDESPKRALAKLSDQTLAPARSLAERTLASLLEPSNNSLAVPHRLIVAADGSAMFTTIGAAIAVAVDGDEIVVEPGFYEEHLTIDRSIRISGHGPREDIILWPQRPDAPGILITAGSAHLSGFFISGPTAGYMTFGTWDMVVVAGGTPVLEALDIGGGMSVAFSGPGTGGAMRSCSRFRCGTGVDVSNGASPTIENNDISGTAHAGIVIRDPQTAPSIRGNQIHDGELSGVVVTNGACPTIDENEIWANSGYGLIIGGEHSSPWVTGNTVRNGAGYGLFVFDRASPKVHGNRISGNIKGSVVVADDASPVIGLNVIEE